MKLLAKYAPRQEERRRALESRAVLGWDLPLRHRLQGLCGNRGRCLPLALKQNLTFSLRGEERGE